MVRSKERIAKRVNRAMARCGLPQTAKPWPIRYESLAKGVMGLASCDNTGEPLVKIEQIYYNPKRPKQAEEIYAHELIHHALPKAMTEVKIDWDGSHGKTFRRVALAAGLKGWGDKTWAWKWTCPKCRAWVKTHKRGKIRYCTYCPAQTTQKTVTVDGIRHLATMTTRVAMRSKKILEVQPSQEVKP